MKNSKKGVELSLNTIIIAILVIVVLVVLVLILTGKTHWFGTSLNQCGGHCVETAGGCEEGEASVPMKNCDENADDDPDGSYCCMAIMPASED